MSNPATTPIRLSNAPDKLLADAVELLEEMMPPPPSPRVVRRSDLDQMNFDAGQRYVLLRIKSEISNRKLRART